MFSELYYKYLNKQHDTGKYRSLKENIANNDGSRLADFSSNDYLALSNNKAVLNAGIKAANQYGVGGTGSRLLSGDLEIYKKLESQIAKDQKSQAALIFNSGFQANISVLSSLLDQSIIKQQAIVFCDKGNHASLYSAMILAKAKIVRYQHLNYEQLEKLLIKYSIINLPKFIVTESVFSMDGDIVNLSKVINLCAKYNIFLYLDEAHATGILGKYGYGLATDYELSHIDHLVMGTFSKALGVSGGFVAGNQLIINYLINNAKGFIYSTAMSPFIAGAVQKSWSLVKNYQQQRKQLLDLSDYLRHELMKSHFNIGHSSTNIIPVIIGCPQKTISIQNYCAQNEIIVSAIRSPTVPPNTDRLRIAINCKHTKKDIKRLVEVLTAYEDNNC